MITRTGWTFLVLAVGLLGVGTWLSYRELVTIGAALVLCVASAALWMCRRSPLDVSRDVVPTRVSEGEAATGVLTVVNAGRHRSRPLVAVEAFGSGSVAVDLAALGAGASQSVAYRLPTNRRGCYEVGPLVIGNADPLRLASTATSYGDVAHLWVHPQVHEVAPIPTGRSHDLDGPRTTGAPSGGIAFHSLREYEPGDDPRLIHWRSTARTGTLMVRHTVVTNEPRLLIVLDTSERVHRDRFEDAVRIAASLVAAGAARRYPTELRTTGGLRGSIDANGVGRTDVLDKLASVDLDDGPGLDALTALAARRAQGVALGVVTGDPGPTAAAVIGRVRDRFEMVSVVQVASRFEHATVGLPGTVVVTAGTSLEFARTWNRRFR